MPVRLGQQNSPPHVHHQIDHNPVAISRFVTAPPTALSRPTIFAPEASSGVTTAPAPAQVVRGHCTSGRASGDGDRSSFAGCVAVWISFSLRIDTWV